MRHESSLRMLSGLVLVGVFAAGALFGAGLLRWTATAPERFAPPRGNPIDAMTHELALDSDQVARLQAIHAAHRGELDGILRTTQSQVRDVLYAIEDELRPHLRPDQVQRLEVWRAHRPPAPLPGMGPPAGMGPPPPGMGPLPGMGPPPGSP